MLFAGVDGGQSGSRVVIADETGRIRARVEGGPLFVSDGGSGADLVARLAALVHRARDEAGVEDDAPLRAVVAGISGQDVAAQLIPEALGAVTARLVHDTEVAHAGALAGYHGVVVIAGSGSVAFGTDGSGRRVRVGGWGRLFGDEGSAFWIARLAIASAMRATDEGRPTRVTSAVLAHFGVESLRGLQRAALRGELRADDVAGFAPGLLTLGGDGDPVAGAVLRGAAGQLSRLVVAVDAALAPQEGRAVSFAGRVFDSRALREAWHEAVAAALRRPRIFPPRAEPVVGALLMAYRDAEVAAPPAVLQPAT